jgi:hypothetical protein
MEIKPYFLVKLDTCMKTTKTKRFYNLNKNKTGLVPNPNHETKQKTKQKLDTYEKKIQQDFIAKKK